MRTDDEIAGWTAPVQDRVAVAAVDAPVVVPDEDGHRPAERLLGRAFGAFGASAHVANRRTLGGEPRAMRLARRFGWYVDPDRRTGDGAPVCIEVYPHAALVGLFRLGYRIGYKKGGVARRRAGFGELVHHLESVPQLALRDNDRWRRLASAAADPGSGDLDRIEDEIDAVVWRTSPGCGSTGGRCCRSTGRSRTGTSWRRPRPATAQSTRCRTPDASRAPTGRSGPSTR